MRQRLGGIGRLAAMRHLGMDMGPISEVEARERLNAHGRKQCRHCGRKFKTTDGLNHHVNNKHQGV